MTTSYNPTTAMIAAGLRSESVERLAQKSGTHAGEILRSFGAIPEGEYENSVVISMLAAEVLSLRARVEALEAAEASGEA